MLHNTRVPPRKLLMMSSTMSQKARVASQQDRSSFNKTTMNLLLLRILIRLISECQLAVDSKHKNHLFFKMGINWSFLNLFYKDQALLKIIFWVLWRNNSEKLLAKRKIYFLMKKHKEKLICLSRAKLLRLLLHNHNLLKIQLIMPRIWQTTVNLLLRNFSD